MQRYNGTGGTRGLVVIIEENVHDPPLLKHCREAACISNSTCTLGKDRHPPTDG